MFKPVFELMADQLSILGQFINTLFFKVGQNQLKSVLGSTLMFQTLIYPIAESKLGETAPRCFVYWVPKVRSRRMAHTQHHRDKKLHKA